VGGWEARHEKQSYIPYLHYLVPFLFFLPRASYAPIPLFISGVDQWQIQSPDSGIRALVLESQRPPTSSGAPASTLPPPSSTAASSPPLPSSAPADLPAVTGAPCLGGQLPLPMPSAGRARSSSRERAGRRGGVISTPTTSDDDPDGDPQRGHLPREVRSIHRRLARQEQAVDDSTAALNAIQHQMNQMMCFMTEGFAKLSTSGSEIVPATQTAQPS
jgi:hypothetical protein